LTLTDWMDKVNQFLVGLVKVVNPDRWKQPVSDTERPWHGHILTLTRPPQIVLSFLSPTVSDVNLMELDLMTTGGLNGLTGESVNVEEDKILT